MFGVERGASPPSCWLRRRFVPIADSASGAVPPPAIALQKPTTWVECPPRDTQPFTLDQLYFSQVIFLSVIGLYFCFLHGRPLASSLQKGAESIRGNLTVAMYQTFRQNYEKTDLWSKTCKTALFAKKCMKPHFVGHNSETKGRTCLWLTSKLLQRGIQMPCIKKHVSTEKIKRSSPNSRFWGNIWECAKTKWQSELVILQTSFGREVGYGIFPWCLKAKLEIPQ